MGAGTNVVLAVCGGGGTNGLAVIVALAGILLWILLARLPLATAEDGAESLALICLLVGSVVLGGLVFLYPHGTSGNGDCLARFFLSLAVTTGVGFGVAVVTRRVHVGRALLVAFLGDVFIPGGLILLLFSSLVIGTGCLD